VPNADNERGLQPLREVFFDAPHLLNFLSNVDAVSGLSFRLGKGRGDLPMIPAALGTITSEKLRRLVDRAISGSHAGSQVLCFQDFAE
jgi:hypothetical protein